jgi:hypothetical protein
MAMTAKADFVSVGPAMAADVGQTIVWQVSLYRMKSEISCCTDWRDMSTAHSFMLETAYQDMTGGDVTHFVLPATAEDATAAGAGDWVVDLPHWTQLNMETNTRRRIRRCVITDPPSATSAEA